MKDEGYRNDCRGGGVSGSASAQYDPYPPQPYNQSPTYNTNRQGYGPPPPHPTHPSGYGPY